MAAPERGPDRISFSLAQDVIRISDDQATGLKVARLAAATRHASTSSAKPWNRSSAATASAHAPQSGHGRIDPVDEGAHRVVGEDFALPALGRARGGRGQAHGRALSLDQGRELVVTNAGLAPAGDLVDRVGELLGAAQLDGGQAQLI